MRLGIHRAFDRKRQRKWRRFLGIAALSLLSAWNAIGTRTRVESRHCEHFGFGDAEFEPRGGLLRGNQDNFGRGRGTDGRVETFGRKRMRLNRSSSSSIQA